MKLSDRPTAAQLRQELARRRYRRELGATLRNAAYTLLAVAAAAVLITTLALPVLQVTGSSMEPTMTHGEIVIAVKDGRFQRGEVVAFYYNNEILLKRVIALAGDYVSIAEDGTVSINQIPLEEPYLEEKSLGECDLEFPYQVPEGRLFVMGDHRTTSVDSRCSTIGCIAEEMIVGRVLYRVWPLKRLGPLNSSE